MSALCDASSRFSGHSMLAICLAGKVVFSPFSTLQRNNCSTESSTIGHLSPTANSVRNFDICLSGSKSCAGLEPSSDHARNCEIWNGAEKKFERVSQVRALRPGMVLLRHYITHDEQVGIIRSCQKLGLGPGGFYQLGNHGRYIMGLGLTWDPKRRMYELWRSVDGAKTHDIPEDYSLLVKRSIQDAHAHLKKDLKVTNLEVEDILPSMSPTVCIVNFYTTLATLALHQDQSESKGSLRNGLPIVSFSLGDSAEFMYVDGHKVKKVILESGDVLMFGGKSRHIRHGVGSIIPNSAPKQLLEESRLRPGRLNLTFRQF